MDLPLAELNSQDMLDVRDRMQAGWDVLAGLDLDMEAPPAAEDRLWAALIAGLAREIVADIDTACDRVVWVSFESHL